MRARAASARATVNSTEQHGGTTQGRESSITKEEVQAHKQVEKREKNKASR
jgi:hypothetical protein